MSGDGASGHAGRLDVADAVADKRPEIISGMFDAIARQYDFLNHFLSGGADWYWRWRAVRALRPVATETLLDVCTGTGDLAIEALRRTRVRRVVGIDFAGEMLKVGRAKLARGGWAARAVLVRGDATRIPLADGTVDAAMVAFGIRNVQSAEVALQEMARVLKPDGRLAVLEFSMPQRMVIREVYAWYFRHVLPRIGGVISRRADAYTYLPTSVASFSTPEQFTALLEACGFTRTRAVALTFGVVYLYVAVRQSR
jgi:demethylmenaquinone methyltransferase/2-methoxy-6-polyprenyl-1,4-benzoquinol methylase